MSKRCACGAHAASNSNRSMVNRGMSGSSTWITARGPFTFAVSAVRRPPASMAPLSEPESGMSVVTSGSPAPKASRSDTGTPAKVTLATRRSPSRPEITPSSRQGPLPPVSAKEKWRRLSLGRLNCRSASVKRKRGRPAESASTTLAFSTRAVSMPPRKPSLVVSSSMKEATPRARTSVSWRGGCGAAAPACAP
ncbi:hypothetical protein ACFOEX_11610, partial [Camelimonas abortus]